MDIIKIFKSKTRKVLFRLYFTNPEKAYYLRELERQVGIPVSMLRKELVSLEKEGLFSSSRKGNLLYYSLNKKYPLYTELKNITFKTVGVQGALLEKLSAIKGIYTAFIYGSYAKNQANVSSDIDLFIVGEIDENALIKNINKLEKELQREINYTLYSKKDFLKKKSESDPFIKDVLRNKKTFLIGEKNDLR
ncbi:MAG: nucleotidyltransferase domain-containing protein [Candidatus Omnitrophica bacterium]|nr:nucleotidyltransferase domain-containing protein [Candidatus Omnitrophota bacterium]